MNRLPSFKDRPFPPLAVARRSPASSETRPKLRLFLFKLAVLLGFGVLLAQTWNLQIAKGELFQERADRNRFRLISVTAPRGVIYDRQGQLLVRNVPSFTVSIVPADLPEELEFETINSLVRKLRGMGGTSPSAGRILDLVAEGRLSNPYSPLAVAYNVPRDAALVIQEESLDLPGVQVTVDSRREYLTGPLTSHIVGYVGPIPQEQWEAYQSSGDYEPSDLVGLTGVELTFEDVLRGDKGRKHIEVDALGREIRTVSNPLSPQPGQNLILTIDLEFQEQVAQILQRGMEQTGSSSGVAIAMDPRTGEILAMVSLPTYDNNLFIGGISLEDYQALIEGPERPLVNHAVTGQYPPGSTFKIALAAAGLQEGVVTRNTRIFDPGLLRVPNQYAPDDPSLDQLFYDWTPAGHGTVNFIEAVAQSCDIYFYLLAGGYHGREPIRGLEGLGLDRVVEYARLFGFGQPTDIELPSEAAGLVPDARWKREVYAEPWTVGDTYNMAIGQGFVLATPLQVLNAAAAIANGGTLLQLQIVRETRDAEGNIVEPFRVRAIRHIPVDPEYLQAVREGMKAAVAWGTATRAGLSGVTVAGKTGTAEHPGPRDAQGNLPTHAWFVGFAPADDAEIAVVVFLERGNGARDAAPVAGQIMAAYFSPSQGSE